MKTSITRKTLLLVLLAASTCCRPVAASEPEIYFVPDVVEQFKALALRPEALGFGLHNSPDPSLCRHYQGMARNHGKGPPYFFLTRSGNDPGIVPCPISDVDGPGNLLVVRMDSRDTTGERLRSNRLKRNSDIDEYDQSSNNLYATPPDYRDRVVAWFSFDGQNGWPPYQHPGGVQVLGDVLAVPVDTRMNSAWPEYLVTFFDVSNPEHPIPTSCFAPTTVDGSPLNTSVVGLTPVLNPDGAGCRYLMVGTGGRNQLVTFWRSLPTRSDGSTDLKSPNLDWERVGEFTEPQIEGCLGGRDWPTGLQEPYQALNFVREGSLNGRLFIIGAQNTLFLDEDWLQLYQVNIDEYGVPNPTCPFSFKAAKHVTSRPIMGGGDSANFAAAAGVYISPSGELIVYGAEYDNDGPRYLDADGNYGDRTVRMGEWRHREMVRPDSPTLRPSIEVQDTFAVDEGSAIVLSAQPGRPVTKAWIQFFEDEGLGLGLPGFIDSDRWLVVDYDDWDKDNFDKFGLLHFNDEADSMRWFAPVGCTIRVNQHSFDDPSFPGGLSLELPGIGAVQQESVLDNVRGGDGSDTIGDKISSVQFLSDCDSYYNAPIGIDWDLNDDGIFETRGIAVFSAAALDGPAVHVAHVRAQHATDPTALGQSAPKPVRIEVRNVAPSIESFAIFDSLGLPALFALPHLPYSVAGTFTDPGKPDRQTATLSWSDGLIEPHTVFELFTDAFGGKTGEFSRDRTFDVPGEYSVQLDLRDDDGGASASSLTIHVLSPTDALGLILQAIDHLLASASDPDVIRALTDARNQIDGTNGGQATDGAIDKLADQDPLSAVVKLGACVSALTKAESSGAGDLSSLKYLVALIAEAIAQADLLRVTAALPQPNGGQQKQLNRIAQSILQGHLLLASGQYSAAIDPYYKDAVGRSIQMP